MKVLPLCDLTLFFDNENGFECIAGYAGNDFIELSDYKPKWFTEIRECLE
jgi:hypothetical protein